MSKYWRDALERILWTTLAVAIPYATVYVADLPVAWAPLGSFGITLLKVLVAGHVGNEDTAKFDKKDPS